VSADPHHDLSRHAQDPHHCRDGALRSQSAADGSIACRRGSWRAGSACVADVPAVIRASPWPPGGNGGMPAAVKPSGPSLPLNHGALPDFGHVRPCLLPRPNLVPCIRSSLATRADGVVEPRALHRAALRRVSIPTLPLGASDLAHREEVPVEDAEAQCRDSPAGSKAQRSRGLGTPIVRTCDGSGHEETAVKAGSRTTWITTDRGTTRTARR